jgi:hypothetical protein
MAAQIIIMIVFGALFLYTQWRLNKANEQIRRLEHELNYYQKTFLRRQGGTSFKGGVLNYELRSLDCGKNWYAVDCKEGEVKILGSAEDVYPGLLAHLDGMQALINYVEKNGPIGSRPFTQNDLEALSKAGFKVESKG